MIGGHGADLRDQFLTDIFGERLLVDFSGEMIPALGRIFMERSLEEIQREVDVVLELLLAELEELR